MDKTSFGSLETKINAIIQLCESLQMENHQLKQKQAKFQEIQSQLQSQNQLAKEKITEIINAFKEIQVQS